MTPPDGRRWPTLLPGGGKVHTCVRRSAGVACSEWFTTRTGSSPGRLPRCCAAARRQRPTSRPCASSTGRRGWSGSSSNGCCTGPRPRGLPSTPARSPPRSARTPRPRSTPARPATAPAPPARSSPSSRAARSSSRAPRSRARRASWRTLPATSTRAAHPARPPRSGSPSARAPTRCDPRRGCSTCRATGRWSTRSTASARTGAAMMCSTTAVQVSLDAGEGRDVALRWAALHAIGPVLLAAFANSPRMHGRRTGWKSTPDGVLAHARPRPHRPAAVVDDDPAGAWARRALADPAAVRAPRRAPGGVSWSGRHVRRLDRRRAAGRRADARRPRLPPDDAVPAGAPAGPPRGPLHRRAARAEVGGAGRGAVARR